MSGRNAALRGVPRLLTFLCVVALTFGADAPARYKGVPLWLLRPLFAAQARAAVNPAKTDKTGLRFAHTFNKTATEKHTPYRVAAIGCHPWTAGLVACDVLFVRKATGQFSCAVVALDPAAIVVAAQAAACPASVTGGGPKA